MRIIVATDLETASASAVELAAAMARRLGDTLVLVHAFEWRSGAYGMSFETMMPEVAERARGFTKARLRNAAAELRNTGLLVEERLLDAPVAEAIVEVASEPDVRLIVLGTHAHSAPARLVLGSVSERVAMLSARPVLVAKAGLKFDQPAGSNGPRPLRIAVGLDVSTASHAAVTWVRELIRTTPCEITAMHAYHPADEAMRLGMWSALSDVDEAVVQILMRKLAPLVEGLVGSRAGLRLLPTFGSVADRIVMEAEQLQADILVIGNHQRRALRRLRLGSMSHPVLRSAKVPVLIIPTTGTVEEEQRLPEIRSVLLATDFSDFAASAVRHAYGLVRHTRGVVHICHVHERPPSIGASVEGLGPESYVATEHFKEVEAALRALVPREAVELGIISRFHIMQAVHAGEALCQVARQLGVDAICLGSHGRGGLTGKILGSVAQQLMSHADQPVYVVRGTPE